jgi:hypothetical protein
VSFLQHLLPQLGASGIAELSAIAGVAEVRLKTLLAQSLATVR